MQRIYDVFRLEQDGLDYLVRAMYVGAWGMPTRSPGEVYLSRVATRIYSDDPRLDSDQGWGMLEWLRDLIDAENADDLFLTGFAFDDDDQYDDWDPQGLSGTADADDSGKVDAQKFLVVGWHNSADYSPTRPMSCVSLINVSSMNDIRYRHLLLVSPTVDASDFATFESVDTHCGGIVWFGRWLFVASSSVLHVFDMEHITDIKEQNPDYPEADYVGLRDGKYQAGGFRYILPLSAVYAIADDEVFARYGNYFDTLGLDRSTDPPRLVAAAYVGAGYDPDPVHRVVVFFDLDESTGLLTRSGGNVDSSDAADTETDNVQGVHARGDEVWFCTSPGGPSLIRKFIGSEGGGRVYYWAEGGEGLTYSPSTDHLWKASTSANGFVSVCTASRCRSDGTLCPAPVPTSINANLS